MAHKLYTIQIIIVHSFNTGPNPYASSLFISGNHGYCHSFLAHASEIKRINYEDFTVWLDCDRRGAVMHCNTMPNMIRVTLNVLNRLTLTLLFLHHANNSPLKHIRKRVSAMTVVIWFQLIIWTTQK